MGYVPCATKLRYMTDEHLLTEGDVNFSAHRQEWYKVIDGNTIQLLGEDADVFMHQSLSTPCLDVIASCEGIYITDTAGKRYMDFHGNNVHQIGYRNQYVVEKLKAQMDLLPFCPRRYTNTAAIQFAKKLTSLLPGPLNRVLFAPGGTSVIGMALKLARVVTGKYKVVSYKDSFHGASLDAIAAGGEGQFKKYMGPFNPEPQNVAPPDSYRNIFGGTNDEKYADELEVLFKTDPGIGAFIAETIRNTDAQVPTKAYWQRVRALCTQYNVLLILDEIPIAFGRTGKMFAFEHYGIEPDIICLGKGLGAGIIPFAAMVAKNEYNIAADVSLGHYTHEKSPMGSVAATAMLEYIEQENLVEKAQTLGQFLGQALRNLQTRYPIIGDVRGIGLLWGVELVKDRTTKEKAIAAAEQVMYACLKNGLSFKVSQGNVLQLCPPLVITEQQLQEAVDILAEALEEASNK